MRFTNTFGRADTDLNAVREVSLTINATHLFIYFIPEAAKEAAKLGVTAYAPAYFAFRSAPMGPVPWQVTLAAFYNFSPRSVQAMADVWAAASPEQWQTARFTAAGRALRRVDVNLTADQITEARSLIDPVVASADYAGKTMAAANASVPLPADPLVALWQQITVLREWRGDAHFTVLAANGIGPCDCNVLQTATGHFPEAIARATRLWEDEEVAGSTPTAPRPMPVSRHASRSRPRPTSTAPRCGHRSATRTPVASPRSSCRSTRRSPQPGHIPSPWKREAPSPPLRGTPGSPDSPDALRPAHHPHGPTPRVACGIHHNRPRTASSVRPQPPFLSNRSR
jgi:hypothetical protein